MIYDDEPSLNFKNRFIITVAATLIATVMGNYAPSDDSQAEAPQPKAAVVQTASS